MVSNPRRHIPLLKTSREAAPAPSANTSARGSTSHLNRRGQDRGKDAHSALFEKVDRTRADESKEAGALEISPPFSRNWESGSFWADEATHKFPKAGRQLFASVAGHMRKGSPRGRGALTNNGGSTPVELHQVLPREQVGAVTGDRYDFQYHQAAADSLEVLDDSKVTCVYCEWHDDYVIETAGVSSYRFHQVKTRSASQGPWTLNEFFGVKRSLGRPKKGTKPSGTATTDSIFGRLLDHVSRLGARCEHFVFVTDAGITDDFFDLLSDIRGVTSTAALSTSSANEFSKLFSALSTAFPSLTAGEFFHFLKRLHVRDAVGKLNNLRECRTLIGARIYEMSEVNLSMSEAQKIGSSLVAAVRERSHRTLGHLPATVAELQTAKGLVRDDVLRILSLSDAGYRELKFGGRAAVVALSRLHRLCKRSGVNEALIPDLCRLKTEWEAWWITQRHSVNQLDYLTLKKACADAMLAHADGKLDFEGMRTIAKGLAAKFVSILTSAEPITEELIFGLLLSLAVEAEQ